MRYFFFDIFSIMCIVIVATRISCNKTKFSLNHIGSDSDIHNINNNKLAASKPNIDTPWNFSLFPDILRNFFNKFNHLNADGLPLNTQGRKKKYKKHGGMMMLGFATIALFAQLILGKIIFLAAAALVMSKAALLFSTVNGLKKSSSGQAEVYVEPHGSYGNGGYN